MEKENKSDILVSDKIQNVNCLCAEQWLLCSIKQVLLCVCVSHPSRAILPLCMYIMLVS